MRQVAMLAWLIGLAACGRARECPPALFDLTGLNRPVEMATLEKAPVVFVGTVIRVQGIGRPQPALGAPQLLIECTEITADIENSLKGEIRGQRVIFYYYVLSRLSAVDLGPPKYIPVVGARRIFFLTYAADQLRSIGDVRDYTLRVASGYHSNSALDALPFGQKVATILLTPGLSYNPVAFAKSLDESAFVSDKLSSTDFTDSLLQRLTRLENAEIARPADELLVDRISWRKTHVDGVRSDQHPPA